MKDVNNLKVNHRFIHGEEYTDATYTLDDGTPVTSRFWDHLEPRTVERALAYNRQRASEHKYVTS